jgi:hypothetical protein
MFVQNCLQAEARLSTSNDVSVLLRVNIARFFRCCARYGPLPLLAALGACGGEDSQEAPAAAPPPIASPAPPPPPPSPPAPDLVGAVYVGTDNSGDIGNFVVAFGRRADGVLVPLDFYPTNGNGRGVFRDATGPIRLNPLISEDSLLAVDDQYLLVVNAGSNTISSLRINADFTLTFIDQEPTGGVSPISIAHRDGVVYVANADEDGVFTGPPDQAGNVSALRLDRATGALTPISGSSRSLGARPADLELSRDGRFLVVSALNAGSARLASPNIAEISSYGVLPDGTLSTAPAGASISTLPGNAENRNLPNAIGIETFERAGRQFVIAAEARTVSAAGQPGTFETLQTGSVSTWEIADNGAFIPRSQDFLLGADATSGPTQAGWIVMAPDAPVFWVASATGATISGFGLYDDGTIARGELLMRGEPAAVGASSPLANADGFVDLAISGDGRYIYQLVGLKGRVDVYEVDTLVAYNIARRQEASTGLLPMDNLQGIVSVDKRPR